MTALLATAGFDEVTVDQIATTWVMPDIDVLLRAFATWAQLDTLPPATRDAVEHTVREAAGRYRTKAGVEVPNPMLLLAGSR